MIIVFGSINADVVTLVDQHPSPGETVSGNSYAVLPGGKGANQALAACKSGSATKMFGAVGSDAFASQAMENLTSAGVILHGVQKEDGATGVALIVVDANGENTIVVTPGANAKVSCSALVDQQFSLLITQNEIAAEEVWKAHRYAQKHGAVVVHNAAPAKTVPKAVLPNIDYLVVNESEVVLVAESLGYIGAEPREAARFIQSVSKNAVVVTLGEKGAFATIGSEEFEVNSLIVEVADTTGAGDAFVGAFAAALERGKDFPIALRHGVVAGSLACRSVGAQSSIANLEEIAAHIID